MNPIGHGVHQSVVSKSDYAMTAFAYLDKFLHYPTDPHRNLLVAVLKRACTDLESNVNQHRMSAKQWFFNKDDRPFGFLWICAVLELCPIRIKRELIRKGFIPGIN